MAFLDGDVLGEFRHLLELGWPAERACTELNLSADELAAALTDPVLKADMEKALGAPKDYAMARLDWHPREADLALVQSYAKDGLGPVEIASKMNVTRAAFLARMEDNLRLRDAFEMGEGKYRAELIKESQDLIDEGGSRAKNVASLVIFKLKAHCGFTDQPKQLKPVEVKVEHTHRLKAPEPVKIEDMAEFARKEMELARKLSEEKLKSLTMEATFQDAEED